MEIQMMTKEQAEAARLERLNEKGEEPPCPFCQRPRVKRSDYIRCNPCATNWLMEEMHLPNYLNVDPRVARKALARTESIQRPIAGQPAESAE